MRSDFRRLPMDGMYNTRDLGGYAAEGGSMTRYRRFLRTDMPVKLSERDDAYLRGLGLSYCIDLRSPYEWDKYPHYFKGSDIPVHEVYFMESIGDHPDPDMQKGLDTLEKLYIYMADNCKDKVAEVFEAIAAAPEGIVMFNCTAGKDRTGITAALLLAACGVAYYDIVADYMVSEIYNRSIIEHIDTVSPEVSLAYHKSDPGNIESFFEHIGGYDGTNDYLYSCGLDRPTLKKVTKRLLG